MKYIKTLIALMFAVILFNLAGCANTVGAKIDTSYVSKIVKGQTTKKEVLDHLGKPYQWATTPQGETWNYVYNAGMNMLEAHARALMGNLNENKTQSLTIHFTGDVVKDYSLSGGADAEHFGTIKDQPQAVSPSSQLPATLPDAPVATPAAVAPAPEADPVPPPPVKKAKAKPKVQKTLPSATASTLM